MALLPVFLATSLAAGIGTALLVPGDPRLAVALLAVATAVAPAALARGSGRVVLVAAGAGVMAAGFALGVAAESKALTPTAVAIAEAASGPAVVEGVLVEDASAGANGVRLRTRIQSIDGRAVAAGEHVALTVGGALALGRLLEWRAGRSIRAPASLRRPARYLNEGVPDDRHALARRGLVLVGTVKSGALVELLASGNRAQEFAANLRARVRRALATHVQPRDATAAAIAMAILIGDRAGLDPALEDRLQAAGTYHVIAISGGNIAVLTAVLLAVARVVRLSPRLTGPIACAVLVAHAALVGAGPSVVRATTMAAICLGLRSLDQSAWSVNALAVAAAALLLASPLSLVDAGFVLSVGATAAIVVLAPRLVPPSASGGRRAVAGVVAASLSTELVLLPVSATLFNRVTVAGLVLNLVAVPLMAVVQAAASLTVAFDAVSESVASSAGWVTTWAARGLVGSSQLVELWPWLSIRIPAPSWWVASLYAIALAVAAQASWTSGPVWWPRLRYVGAWVAALTAGWILTAPSTWRWPWRADGLLRVVALDVGQGDATLIEFPDGGRWLVDAGGLAGSSFDVGARVVAPALWTRGTGRLDALVLTHGDPDHIGGAGSLIADFRPAIYEGVPVPRHVALQRLVSFAASRGRSWQGLSAGQRFRVGRVDVHVWHPPPPDWERVKVRNDDSVVLELRYGEVSVVLPGDVGADVERVLAPRLAPARRRALKAAHHGSAGSTSAEWLDALRPDVVLFSCGRENRYGHPAEAVLRRVQERGAKVLRTDRDGQVVVETDGAELRVTTYLQSEP